MMRPLRIGSLVLAIPILAVAADDPTAGPPPKDKPHVAGWGFYPQFPQAWMNFHKQFLERSKKGGVHVVFLGDSITQGWGDAHVGLPVWNKNFAMGGKAVNYGIGGDSTRQVLWRIAHGELDGIKPRAVVLMIGTNNLYADHNAGSDVEIAQGITAVVDAARAKSPETRVLLLGILPRQNDYFCNRIKKINTAIAGLHDAKTVWFLDLSDKFLAAPGKVNPDLYAADQIHLSPKGYEVWAEIMEPVLDELFD